MNTKISNLKNLRVYRHLSISQLLSHLVCNRIMKSRPLVAAAPSIYQYLCYFPGKTLTNLFISSTFNRMFTLGNSLEQLAHNSQHLAKQNIPLMVDFCAQGIAGEPKNEENLNQNAREFTRSAIWAAKHKGYLFSIKISGLIDFKLLLKYNNAVELRDVLWRQSCENGVFSAQKLFQNCKRIYQGLSEYDFQAYLKQIHNFSGDAKTFKIDQTQFKMNHQPYYLYQPSKNQILLIKLMFPLDSTEQGYMLALLRRLDQILEAEFQNPNQVRVLVDAQQSYIQRALESLTEQIQERYNRQKAYIIPTLQNYLKTAKERVDYEIELARRRNLWFGIKLVRGAYLVEETQLALKNKKESPIVPCFDSTTENYLGNFAKIIGSGLKGEIFLAGHNQQTIQALLQIKSKNTTNLKINFAQLYGLGDHLTYLLKRQRENVYKLLPWAQTEVMVPYMIRRAQELSQMRYPLDTQSALLRHQLAYRIFPY